MTRIMLSKKNWFGILALLLFFISGCGRSDYRHREVGIESSEAQKIKEMLIQIRDLGESGVQESVRKFGAADLPADRITGLERLFTEMAAAEGLKLLDLDRFGGKVYRATLLFREADETSTVHVLLVEIDNQLFWAGVN